MFPILFDSSKLGRILFKQENMATSKTQLNVK